MYYLPNSCMFLFFLFSLFHHLPCAISQQKRRLCDTLFHCGNITADFPFSDGNRPKVCGHPLVKLHCVKNTTSLIISNHMYDVLHIDQTSKTLRLARAELRGSFCNATFTEVNLPPEICELSPTYKSLTVFYLCDHKVPYRSSYACPGKCPVSVSQTLDYHNSCSESFTINVPKSFVPEEKELNMTNLESVLSKGFEVKVNIVEKSGCLKNASGCSRLHQPGSKDLEKGDSGKLNRNGITCEEEEIAKKMRLVGLWCIQSSPSDRPPMNRVVEMMEGSLDALEVPPRPVLQIPTAPLPESPTVLEDISVYTEVCSMNIA